MLTKYDKWFEDMSVLLSSKEGENIQRNAANEEQHGW